MLKIKEFKGLPVATPTACALGPRTQAWQKATDYGQRSLVETTMGRYKALIGPRLRARGFDAQQTEAAIGVAVLNRMLAAGRPDSIRRMRVIA